jgi:hypothetical protein
MNLAVKDISKLQVVQKGCSILMIEKVFRTENANEFRAKPFDKED